MGINTYGVNLINFQHLFVTKLGQIDERTFFRQMRLIFNVDLTLDSMYIESY